MNNVPAVMLLMGSLAGIVVQSPTEERAPLYLSHRWSQAELIPSDLDADGHWAGFPAIRCDGFTPGVQTWRIGCLNRGSHSEIVALNERGGPALWLGRFDETILLVSSISLHDRIVIRVVSKGKDGKTAAAEYIWKPPLK